MCELLSGAKGDLFKHWLMYLFLPFLFRILLDPL